MDITNRLPTYSISCHRTMLIILSPPCCRTVPSSIWPLTQRLTSGWPARPERRASSCRCCTRPVSSTAPRGSPSSSTARRTCSEVRERNAVHTHRLTIKKCIFSQDPNFYVYLMEYTRGFEVYFEVYEVLWSKWSILWGFLSILETHLRKQRNSFCTSFFMHLQNKID